MDSNTYTDYHLYYCFYQEKLTYKDGENAWNIWYNAKWTEQKLSLAKASSLMVASIVWCEIRKMGDYHHLFSKQREIVVWVLAIAKNSMHTRWKIGQRMGLPGSPFWSTAQAVLFCQQISACSNVYCCG